MTNATYQFLIDWNKDGTYEADITSYVLGMATPPEWDFGRDTARSLADTKGAELKLTLNNRDKRFSPDYSSGPYYGNLGPGKPVQVKATFSAVTYIIFQGYIDGYEMDPYGLDKVPTVDITCIDGWTFLGQQNITTTLYEGVTTGQALGYVLDAAGWPSGSTYRDIDTGETICPFFWAKDESTTDVVNDLVASEGPPAIAYIDPSNGKFVFRGRHHRFLDSASITSQATFRDTGTEPNFSAPGSYDVGFKDLVNDVSWTYDERQKDDLGKVWETEDTYVVPASSSLTVPVATDDPFTGAITPVSGTDYTLLSGTLTGVSLSQTSGAYTVITLTAGASAAYVQGLQLRAYGCPVARQYAVTASDSTSQGKHGVATMDGDAPKWASRNDLQAIASIILKLRAERLPIWEITVNNGNSTRITQQLTRTLSDRVTIVETNTATNGDFFIEKINHTIDSVGLDHKVQYSCEKALSPSTYDDASTIFIVGSATAAHNIGSGKLAT